MTSPGARSNLTTSAPSTAWAMTPSGSSAPITAEMPAERAGGSQASSEAAITAKPTKPVSSRLPYSIIAWRSAGGTAPP